MINTRIIPCLLMSNRGLVKSVGFKNPQYVGDPINAVRIFNEKEVDELILLDIDASRQHDSPDFELIADIASEAFMPIAYGGGIKTLEQAKRIVNSGVEKIILNSVALENLKLVNELSQNLGASSTVVAIDVKKDIFGKYKIFNPSTRSLEKKSLKTHIADIVALGVGEILINDISREGSYKGLNLELIKMVTSTINVPLIIAGGTGNLEHCVEASKLGAAAIAVGSMVIYMGKHRAVMINYPSRDRLKEVFVNA